MAVGGGLILGGAAIWLLSQIKKGTPAPSGPGTNVKDLTLLTANTQIAAVPFTRSGTVAALAVDWLGKNVITAISLGLTLFGGFTALIGGVAGIASGPAAVIAVLVVMVIVAAAIFIGTAIQNNAWEQAATAKGWKGLLDDYVSVATTIGMNVSQSMIDSGPPAGAPAAVVSAWPSIARAWASYYAANVIVGYNQVSFGLYAANPWASIAYWEARAMFVQLPYMMGFEGRVAANVVSQSEQALFEQLNPQAKKQAQEWGVQLGRLMWGFLCARKSMLEPWQYDWSEAAAAGGRVGDAIGVSVGGPAGLGSWAPRYGATKMMLGLYRMFGGGLVTGQFGQVQSFDSAGNWIDASQLGDWQAQISSTLAYPYVVDWETSDPESLSISPAPENTKPSGFAGAPRRLGAFPRVIGRLRR